MSVNHEFSSYYGVLPAIVRYNQSLSTRAKLLFVELTAVCSVDGESRKLNNYFSNHYGWSEVSIYKSIDELKESNLISIYNDTDSQRIIKITDYPASVYGGGRYE